MPKETRPLTADDLYQYQIVSDPQISPDGTQVVLCVQQVEPETEKKYTRLWLAAADGTRVRQFTYGQQVDAQPRWSPDGTQIAFLSNRLDEKQTQLFLIPVDGGEARPLTELQGSLATYEWSPDGQQIVVQFRLKDADQVEREKDEQKKKLGVPFRRITRVWFKADGSGYMPQERWHIWVVDALTGEARQLTEGPYDELSPRWSPDGRSILTISNLHVEPDLHPEETELYLIPVEGGEAQHIPAHDGRKMAPAFSPDGRHIAYLGRPQKGHWYQNARLYVVDINQPEGPVRDVSDGFDLQLTAATTGDFSEPLSMMPPVWSADGRSIYCQATLRGNQWLARFEAFSDAPQMEWALSGDPGVMGGFSLDEAGQQMAYFWATTDDPGQIYVRSLDDQTAEPLVLTHFNREWLAAIDHGELEEVWFKAADGYELQGWILKPPGFDSAKTYPSVLEIHGGPQMQYGNLYSHEHAFLAGQGYVVYWSNPRGSQGYGEAHAGAMYGRWGTVDYDDIMAWADYAEQLPTIDPDRMAVAGGSYGGYMTVLIIGRSHRFKAACAQRVVSNFTSFYGSSDFNWGLEYLAGNLPPWQDMAANWEQSPISHIANAQTPTLVVHSEQDQRCDPEQGEQVFVALKKLGVDTELLLLPEESHGLSRSGRTDRRIARLSHMLNWFDQYTAGE